MNYRTFYQKNCQKALKNMVPGSEIRVQKKPIPDPGSRIQGSKSTQSRIPDPGSGSATLCKTFLNKTVLNFKIVSWDNTRDDLSLANKILRQSRTKNLQIFDNSSVKISFRIKPISPSGVFCLGVYYTRDNTYKDCYIRQGRSQ
jgi:hypothetical protein